MERRYWKLQDESALAYYQRFGFLALPDHPRQLFLPLDALRQALKNDG